MRAGLNGTGNTFIGNGAGRYNTTGSSNSAHGAYALNFNTTGSQNSAQGYYVLQNNSTGIQNSAQGSQALNANTTGSYNSAQGYAAGRYIADGTTANATGSNSLFLGANTRANANGETNQIVIGDSAIGAGSNTATLGNTSIVKTVLRGNVGIGTATPTLGPLQMASGAYVTLGGVWTNASDRNLKDNFTNLDPQTVLAKITTLPITRWNYKNEPAGVTHIGPIAQDFYGAFGLGGSDTSISTIDPAGVALLGIQALAVSADLQQNKIDGLTENQAKLAQQITGQLTDQALSLDDKIQIIGVTLDTLNAEQYDKQIRTIKEQLETNVTGIATMQSRVVSLENRYAALESQFFALSEFLTVSDGIFDLKDGMLKAKGIIADSVIAKDIEASDTITTNSLKGQELELGDQVSGTGVIKSGELESEQILTTQIDSTVKLYITPRGSTAGKLLYYDETKVEDGVGFTVTIDAPAIGQDIKFNWLIVK
jgi:hypothetical protein